MPAISSLLPIAWKPFSLIMEGGYKRYGCLLYLAKRGETTGRLGCGECAPLLGWSKESFEEVDTWVRHCLASKDGQETIAALAEAGELPASLQFAWECAECHLLGWQDWSVAATTLSINALLQGSAKEILQKARRCYEEGCRVFKLKTTAIRAKELLGVLSTLRKDFGGDVAFRLDANRTLEFSEALAISEQLVDFSISYWEEPLQEWKRLPEWMEQSPIPVALDETLRDIPLSELERYSGAKALIFKPTLQGGLRRVRAFASAGARFGMQSIVSACYESGWGTYWLGQLAARLPHAGAVGFDTYSWVAQDILTNRLDVANFQFAVAQPFPQIDESRLD